MLAQPGQTAAPGRGDYSGNSILQKAENTPLKGEENRADADFLNDLLLHNNKKIPAFQHTEHLFSCQIVDGE